MLKKDYADYKHVTTSNSEFACWLKENLAANHASLQKRRKLTDLHSSKQKYCMGVAESPTPLANYLLIVIMIPYLKLLINYIWCISCRLYNQSGYCCQVLQWNNVISWTELKQIMFIFEVLYPLSSNNY